LRLAAEDCLALEDSANGLMAALAAGVPTLITTCPYTAHHEFPGALAVIDGLGTPEAPFCATAGDGFGRQWVDLGLLRQWHVKS